MTFEELFALSPGGEGGCNARKLPRTDEPRLFGGLLLGLAVAGVGRDAPGRCHSLHALFVEPADRDAAIGLAVQRTRDGGRYATRQVEVRDGDRLLLTGLSSHHRGDDGPSHQVGMPDVPAPETLEDRREVAQRRQAAGAPPRRFLSNEMLDARAVEWPPDTSHGLEGRRAMWFKPRRPIGGERSLHQAVIAFASDMGLVRVGVQVHYELGQADPLQVTSLDHAIWFHAEADADDWLLHVTRCPVTGEGRGLAHGMIFTRDGRLVASTAQEFLARRRPPRAVAS